MKPVQPALAALSAAAAALTAPNFPGAPAGTEAALAAGYASVMVWLGSWIGAAGDALLDRLRGTETEGDP